MRIASSTICGMVAVVAASVVPGSFAEIIGNAKVIGSDSGFGEITYTPGVNVSDFVIFGKGSAAASYISANTTPFITRGLSQDGATIYNNPYDATTYSWTGGTPSASGTTNLEACQPITPANGWGAAANSYVGFSVTSPADTYKVAFFVHNYYTSADLQVYHNGDLVGTYDNVMSSTYNSGGGEGRNTDFYYDFTIQNVNQNDVIQFKFSDLTDLGSMWSNIGILSASVDYTPSETISSQLVTLAASPVPEPAVLTLFALGATAALRRRRKTA